MTMALILAVPRRLAEGSVVLTGDHEWGGWTPTWMLGIASGASGRHHRHGPHREAVARRARAFGLQIHYHNRKKARRDRGGPRGDLLESLDQMLARMDIISVTARIRRDLSSALGAAAKLMRPDAYIVNTRAAR